MVGTLPGQQRQSARVSRSTVTEFGNTQVQGDDDREQSRRLSRDSNRPPADIEGYTFLRHLGTGAYGSVWLARRDAGRQPVAIKFYSDRRAIDRSLLHREVEKLETLYRSRGIVRLLESDWNADPPYYVMEYVENGSLSALMTRGVQPPAEAVRITREVCQALTEAHGAGVLHCDLKPDNILLDTHNRVRLCDFGQARMSHERSPALGTLFYMAPEQADLDAAADARWDVYAVGAVLYHMLTGEPPFRTPEFQRRLENVTSLQERLTTYRQGILTAPRPDGHYRVRGVDRRLARIIDACLAVDPDERLPNAQAVLNELETRDRLRARRPLLLLGVLGPLLLIAAMVPLFSRALQNNVDQMKRQITAGALERDALSARALAGALEVELQERLHDLQDVLASHELAGALDFLQGTAETRDAAVQETRDCHNRPLSEMPEWLAALQRARTAADDDNRQRNHEIDTSWFLQDREGRQLWRHPYDERTVGQYWAFRDYFHGRNREFAPDDLPDDLTPIQAPHVSLPFTSRSTGQYMVCLSVPIRGPDGTVVGVLGRTAHLAGLRRQIADYIGNTSAWQTDGGTTSHREIALADGRTGQLLDHPWISQQPADRLNAVFSRLILPQDVLTALTDAESQRAAGSRRGRPSEILLEHYEDPVGILDNETAGAYRSDWIAALAPMNPDVAPWVVVVQEKRGVLQKPVDDMTRQARQTVWTALLTGVALMAIVWTFVGRAMARSVAR